MALWKGMGNVIEIDDGLAGFAWGQAFCMFVTVAVGEIEEADGDAG